MMEKIKAFAETVKAVLLYILTPLAFIAGFVFYLLTKNKRLETEIRLKDLSIEQNKLNQALEEASNDAQGKEEDYRKLSNDYKREFGDGESR